MTYNVFGGPLNLAQLKLTACYSLPHLSQQRHHTCSLVICSLLVTMCAITTSIP